MRQVAGSAAAPPTRWRNFRRGSFTMTPPSNSVAERSVRFRARELDHLGPFLGFIGNELCEIGGRASKCRTAQIAKPRLRFGVSENGIDLLVELVDNIGGRGPRGADAINRTCLVTRHEI